MVVSYSMITALTLLRGAVFLAFIVATLAATASWLVRTRRVSPFGALGKALRRGSDPLLRPIEPRVIRLGGNPVNAGWWLVLFVAVAGILLLTTAQWALGALGRTLAVVESGPRGVLWLAVSVAYTVLVAALILRVAGTWFGAGRYTRWMRPAYALTDWLVEPLRRVVPPLGMIDITPIVAWLVLMVAKRIAAAIIF